ETLLLHPFHGGDRRIGVLSRVPLRSVAVDDTVRFSPVRRGLMTLEFGDDRGSWFLSVVHLKSRYTDDPRDPESASERQRESQWIRRSWIGDASGRRHLVVGDFNDVRSSPVVRNWLGKSRERPWHLIDLAD